MAEAGEPLLRQALEANRAYQAAVDENRPIAEVERLRMEADHLFQTVIDYPTLQKRHFGRVGALRIVPRNRALVSGALKGVE